ncbi:hypothetical protein TNCV_4251431 [Trichonephila clavipes]|nr:hypothetical protein TNCV_4251431 [Trichonephila clavipes]
MLGRETVRHPLCPGWSGHDAKLSFCLILLKDDIPLALETGNTHGLLHLRIVRLTVQIINDVNKRSLFRVPKYCLYHHSRCEFRLKIMNASSICAVPRYLQIWIIYPDL